LKDWGFVVFPTDPLTDKIDQTAEITIKWRYISCAVLSVLIIPVNYQRTLGTLRYFSFFIVGTILFCILVRTADQVAMIQSPSYYNTYKDSPDYEVDWLIGSFNTNWFKGFGTLLLSFNCQVTYFYVRAEFMHKSDRRMRKLVTILSSMLVVLFSGMCAAGYLSLGKRMQPDLFTLRRKLSSRQSDQNPSRKTT
jgi:amino acid permease